RGDLVLRVSQEEVSPAAVVSVTGLFSAGDWAVLTTQSFTSRPIPACKVSNSHQQVFLVLHQRRRLPVLRLKVFPFNIRLKRRTTAFPWVTEPHKWVSRIGTPPML